MLNLYKPRTAFNGQDRTQDIENGAVVNLLTVIDHHQMLSVIELLERKFAFKEIGYAI